MEELLSSIQELIKSVARQPMMALLLIIFLVLIWVQVDKLDKINDTLIAIHEDNIKISNYIDAENESSKSYEATERLVEGKLEVILSILNKQ